MQSPPLSIGLTSTQLAILIIMIILALCTAFMLGALSQRNRTHKELLSGQKKQLNNQGTGRPEQLEQLSKIPSDSIEQVQPDSRLPKEMSSRDENGLQHGEGEVEAVNREEEPNAPSVMRYTLQIGAYRWLKNAQETLERIRKSRWLMENQYPSRVQKSAESSFYFVWVGEFDTYNEAARNVSQAQKGLQLQDRPHVKEFMK